MKILNRTANINLKHANKQKVKYLISFVSINQPIINQSIELLFNDYKATNEIQQFPPKHITDQIKSASAILTQCLTKTASSVTRSIVNKAEKALKNQSPTKYQTELLKALNDPTWVPPKFTGGIDLDQRTVEIQVSTSKFFSHYIHIKMPREPKITIPIKLSRYHNNLIQQGYSLNTKSIRIRPNGSIDLYFKKELTYNSNTGVLGIDIGMNKCISVSDGKVETTHKNGLLLTELIAKLNTKFKAMALNRTNYNKKHNKTKQIGYYSKNINDIKKFMNNQIGYSLNHDIDWNNVNQIYLENLKYMKVNNGKYSNGFNKHHWSYSFINQNIIYKAETHGVHVGLIYPEYTSQACRICGHCEKDNRNGELFICRKCGHKEDADIHGAKQILTLGINNSKFMLDRGKSTVSLRLNKAKVVV
jgi:putative transposase